MELLKLFLAIVLNPFVKGSNVVFREEDLVYKFSRPKLFVRLLYLIFYGRLSSPYESFEGMERAKLLRDIANHVTSFRLGRKVFNPIYSVCGISTGYGFKYALCMAWVEGEKPGYLEGRKVASEVLECLLNAGLPTWSLAQPQVHNDMRLVNGEIVCLDYESVLPNLCVPLKELWRALRCGKFAPLDFVDLESLRLECEEALEGGYKGAKDLSVLVATLERIGANF